MNRNLLFLIAFFICNLVLGQSKKDVLNKYPFSKTYSIMIASFQNLQSVSDTLSIIECREIPKINGKINIGGFEQLVKLKKSEYQKLSDIIFSKSIEENIIGKGNCSETGYAILFFDKAGNVFEYIQFCYNCKTFSSSFSQDKLKNEDYDKLNLLKKLFKDNGIEITVYRIGD
jgi:hypothetical protein